MGGREHALLFESSFCLTRVDPPATMFENDAGDVDGLM